MRVAWFSPMPPVPSGIARCSADLVSALSSVHEIDVYVDEPVARMAAATPALSLGARSAHEFVWRHRRDPYELTVYQLGNSSHHDFLWPYLFRYPGLTVLHDAHLHHARAATLLRTGRAADYRAEFTASHPAADPEAAELAVAGFDSFLYYAWPMTRLVIERSRLTAVHAPVLAAALAEELPGATIEAVHLGHGELVPDTEVAAATSRVRSERGIRQDAIVFGVYGGLTPEKRLPQVLNAFEALIRYSPDSHLLLAGAPAEHYDVAADVRRRGLESRVTITGYLESEAELTACIAACDVALALRWPTAREISGPWLRALGAGRATIIMDLEHLSDVPSLDPRTWTLNAGPESSVRRERATPSPRHSSPDLFGSGGGQAPVSDLPIPGQEPRVPSPVCVAIDVMDEDHSLQLAMRRLSVDPDLRRALGAAGRAYWRREHSPERMVADYLALLPRAAAKPAPDPVLPSHLINGGDHRLHLLLADVGVGRPWDKL
ncbi:MAG: hypothetical protein V7647_910 [Acidobacteriota bacterium]|jgi:glycosyltransferase involved in cell wall biosynthesis